MKYYAIGNKYGTSSSLGFKNTYYCKVFESKKSRDAWVDDQADISAW